MEPLEYAILAVFPLSAAVLAVVARYYGWDDQEVLRKQWTLFEGLLALLIISGPIALGVLVGGVFGALVAAGCLGYTFAFLAVYYRE